MIKVLSLGWGVQSFTLAAMSAMGNLPPVDYMIHADTTWETADTYRFAERWTPWLEERNCNVVTVSDRAQARRVGTSKTDIPAFTLTDTGSRGQLRRQCTGRWKIKPQRRYISQELKSLGIPKRAGVVDQWLGISTDEWSRAKDPDAKYISHRYPLLDLGMSRADCITWLLTNGLEVPPKSACVFCPYHARSAWAEQKRSAPEDWETSVAIDLQIRNVRLPYSLFVHPDRVSLSEAVDIPEDHGMVQLDLTGASCDSGHCFL